MYVWHVYCVYVCLIAHCLIQLPLWPPHRHPVPFFIHPLSWETLITALEPHIFKESIYHCCIRTVRHVFTNQSYAHLLKCLLWVHYIFGSFAKLTYLHGLKVVYYLMAAILVTSANYLKSYTYRHIEYRIMMLV